MTDEQEHTHHRLVEEIAVRVEERLVAKFAKWVIVNFFVLLSLAASAIGAYYSLDARLIENRKENENQDRQILHLRIAEEALKQEVIDRLLVLDHKVDEINRFLRDHNQSAVGRQNH